MGIPTCSMDSTSTWTAGRLCAFFSCKFSTLSALVVQKNFSIQTVEKVLPILLESFGWRLSSFSKHQTEGGLEHLQITSQASPNNPPKPGQRISKNQFQRPGVVLSQPHTPPFNALLGCFVCWDLFSFFPPRKKTPPSPHLPCWYLSSFHAPSPPTDAWVEIQSILQFSFPKRLRHGSKSPCAERTMGHSSWDVVSRRQTTGFPGVDWK